MVISLKSNRVDFKISTLGKYNIITGNSGTRKSHFVKTMNGYKKRVSTIICKVTDDLGNIIPRDNIFVLHNDCLFNTDDVNFLYSVHDALFIIDDDVDIMHRKDIRMLLEESDNYFILISREVMGWLPISIDNIYILEKDSRKSIVNIPRYRDYDEYRYECWWELV